MTGSVVITRYMTHDRGNRIVAHQFECPHPAPGEVLTDSTLGTAQLVTREHPSDQWEPPKNLAEDVPYGVWKARVERDGFIWD